MSRRIKIFDTTLRDGEQSPGFSMTLGQKLRVAKVLSELKVDIIEAGFPAASPGDFEAVRAIAREIRGPVIAGLCRTIPARHRAHDPGAGTRQKCAHPYLYRNQPDSPA